ncbi:MAG: VWA domain-containing protein [Oceanospirillales bacterium]|nr:VWA domain-containing protein [Oceanospirillales bacterium]MBR9886098.1 VWA domain-containing protein [Oceanospirillales bacterium]
MNIELAYPLWLLITPLPLLVYWFSPGYKTRRSAIKVPFFSVLLEVIDERPEPGASILPAALWQRAALILSWLLIVLAVAKPVWLAPPQHQQQYGRDVMIAVDLSGSMETTDFTSASDDKISRLEAVKHVLKDFSAARSGDRLGLILFADAAFIQAPFTADHTVWLSLLNEAQVPMAGQSTHLGDALGLAIKVLLEDSAGIDAAEKMTIILTDGNDTGSYIPPEDAAQVARAKGVKVHIIAMGDPETVGETALNMDTIRLIAETTGGRAFQALNTASLDQAYDTINELEPALYKSQTYQPKISLHPYLMMIIVIIYLTAFSLAMLKHRRHRRVHHD